MNLTLSLSRHTKPKSIFYWFDMFGTLCTDTGLSLNDSAIEVHLDSG